MNYGFPMQPQVLFAYVNGYEGAMLYQLPMGCKACLMDRMEQKFYWKEYSTQTGQASVTTYCFYAELPQVKKEEVVQEKPITRSDIEEIVRNALASNKKNNNKEG